MFLSLDQDFPLCLSEQFYHSLLPLGCFCTRVLGCIRREGGDPGGCSPERIIYYYRLYPLTIINNFTWGLVTHGLCLTFMGSFVSSDDFGLIQYQESIKFCPFVLFWPFQEPAGQGPSPWKVADLTTKLRVEVWGGGRHQPAFSCLRPWPRCFLNLY